MIASTFSKEDRCDLVRLDLVGFFEEAVVGEWSREGRMLVLSLGDRSPWE